MALAVLITALFAFTAGIIVGRHPRTPTFDEAPVDLARAIVIESVRDRRADISAALRGRS